MSETKSASERLAEKKKAIADKNLARDAELAEARDEQEILDLEAFETAEAQYGVGAVKKVFMPYFKPGLPTFAIVRSPGGTSYYARYTDMVRKAGADKTAIGKATDMLGESCIVYPDEKALPAVKKEFGGTVASAYVEVIKLAELAGEEEKKG